MAVAVALQTLLEHGGVRFVGLQAVAGGDAVAEGDDQWGGRAAGLGWTRGRAGFRRWKRESRGQAPQGVGRRLRWGLRWIGNRGRGAGIVWRWVDRRLRRRRLAGE